MDKGEERGERRNENGLVTNTVTLSLPHFFVAEKRPFFLTLPSEIVSLSLSLFRLSFVSIMLRARKESANERLLTRKTEPNSISEGEKEKTIQFRFSFALLLRLMNHLFYVGSDYSFREKKNILPFTFSDHLIEALS